MLGWWELAEYASTGIVFIGCVGEFFAEFTRFPRSDRCKHKLARLSLILVIGGIAGELLATVKSSELSGQIIAYVEENASDAKTSADDAAKSALQAKNSAEEAHDLASEAELTAVRAKLLGSDAVSTAKKADDLATTAESRVSKVEGRISKAEEAIEKISPRSLTDEQIAKMSDFLRKQHAWKLEITTDIHAWDAGGIGKQIHDVLNAREWDVGPGLGVGSYSGNPKGFWITVKSREDRNSITGAAVLKQALRIAGIDASIGLDEQSSSAIELNIGPK